MNEAPRFIVTQVKTDGEFGSLNKFQYSPGLSTSIRHSKDNIVLCKDDAIIAAQESVNHWRRNYETFGNCTFRLMDCDYGMKKKVEIKTKTLH